MSNVARDFALLLASAGFAVGIAGSPVAQPAQTVLYSFQGSGKDGANPYGGLVADAEGALYGTTQEGGPSSCPVGGSCGTVFKLTPPTNGETNWTETVLYNFTGGADGANPFAGLIFDKNGALYGTTEFGGTGGDCLSPDGCGVVFQLSPPPAGQTAWTETVIYSFEVANQNAKPFSGLVFDKSENILYGTAGQGGAYNYGTIFQLVRPAAGETAWTASVLYTFHGGSDGFDPKAGLIVDAQGALYSTTEYGGDSACLFNGAVKTGCGTVFRLTPPANGQTAWTKTVLYNFQGYPSDGAFPIAGLIAANGSLYGATYGGGSTAGCNGNGCGTVFKLTPPPAGQTEWTETVLHSFAGGSDGSSPVALLLDAGGLYGTTLENNWSGGYYGTTFKLTPSAAGQTEWTETVLHNFCSLPTCADGAYPTAGLIGGLGGKLYGTTSTGGSCGLSSGCGTVFELQ